jgi:hypothetical protein
MLVPVDNFLPDANPEAAGLRDCYGLMPTTRGMKSAPVSANPGYDALSGVPYGIGSVTSLAGASSLYAGTGSNLYKLSSGTWTDLSRSGGYTVSSRWYFCGFGNNVLASNIANVLQRSTGSTFANVASSPQAEIIEPVGLQVMALNTSSYADQWAVSKLGDETGWSYAIADNSANGRLLNTTGPITAGKALGQNFVAYKENGIYLGTFLGPPTIWGWQLVPGNFGCVGKFAIAQLKIGGNPAHFVVGPDDIFLFDGNGPTVLGSGEVRRWFYNSLHRTYVANTTVLVDATETVVYILFANQSSNGGILNDCLLWNYRTSKWGRGRDYQALLGSQYVTPSATFAAWPDATTFESISADTFDALGGDIASIAPAIMALGNTLKTLTGTPAATEQSSLKTQMYGTDDAITSVSRLRPRFISLPSDAYLYHYSADSLGNTVQQRATRALVNRRFDVLYDGRWHQDIVTINGSFEIDALSVSAEVVSEE